MFKYYEITELNAQVWDYVMNRENRCTLVQQGRDQQLLVIHDAPGMISFSAQAEQVLADLISETSRPE